MTDFPEDPTRKEPTTREEIEALLREAGYDPAMVRASMQRVADDCLERERLRRIDAWLDTLVAEPLTDTEIDAILVRIPRKPRR